jgi:hypothetical protein
MLLPIFLLSCLFAPPQRTLAEEGLRTLVVRERAETSLLDGTFSFRVLKLRGYSIDVRVAGEKRTLKIGESFAPSGGTCSVTFRKISPETRIARFLTDC